MDWRCDIGRAGGRGDILLVYRTTAATRDMDYVERKAADRPNRACRGDRTKATLSVSIVIGAVRAYKSNHERATYSRLTMMAKVRMISDATMIE